LNINILRRQKVYLAKVKIRNFRIFIDLELTLNEGLNLIVGENNSGKTALIDAIRYTLDTNSAEWRDIVKSCGSGNAPSGHFLCRFL